MKILLHTCCGPCAIYPVKRLRDEGHDVTVFFYNPNIHPFKEFKRRLNTLKIFTEKNAISSILVNDYGLKDFVRKVAYHEKKRCTICYSMRLKETFTQAEKLGYDAFSTTLLYSKYQQHEQIKKFCEKLSLHSKIAFTYEDYREGWQFGIEQSKKFDMYRQPYCGCIYSEQERYDKSLRKN